MAVWSKHLAAVGKPTETWESPDGTQGAGVCPTGGRVLGACSPRATTRISSGRILALADAVTRARSFYEGKQWHNSGGDRTWLAPEIDFFFPEFPDLKTLLATART